MLAKSRINKKLCEFCPRVLWKLTTQFGRSDSVVIIQLWLLKSNPRKFCQIQSPERHTNDIPLNNESNTPIPNSECVQVFNNFFSSVFTKETITNLHIVVDRGYRYMKSIDITIDGITQLINNLKVSSSAGIDNINCKLLKNTVSVSPLAGFYSIFLINL